MEQDEFSFAISAGEGTLLIYGTGALDDTNEKIPEEYRETYTVIIGPPDGTGE